MFSETLGMRALTHLPVALLSAETLNGTVRRLGDGYAALLDNDLQRARLWNALGEPQPGIVLSGRTAAWIWGVYRSAPSPVEYAVRPQQRTSLPLSPQRIRREIQLDTNDVTHIGMFEITTPVRTAEDILRGTRELSLADRVACRLLLCSAPGARQLLLKRLQTRKRAPFTRRLRDHLDSL